MAKPRKPRPRKIDLILADPVYQKIIAQNRASEAQARAKELAADTTAIERLIKRLDGRIAKPVRRPRTRLTVVRRDPRDIAFRYLRRYRGGEWYRGGSHVARLHYGPGIGFRNWVNDQPRRIRPIPLNLSGIQTPAASDASL